MVWIVGRRPSAIQGTSSLPKPKPSPQRSSPYDVVTDVYPRPKCRVTYSDIALEGYTHINRLHLHNPLPHVSSRIRRLLVRIPPIRFSERPDLLLSYPESTFDRAEYRSECERSHKEGCRELVCVERKYFEFQGKATRRDLDVHSLNNPTMAPSNDPAAAPSSQTSSSALLALDNCISCCNTASTTLSLPFPFVCAAAATLSTLTMLRIPSRILRTPSSASTYTAVAAPSLRASLAPCRHAPNKIR